MHHSITASRCSLPRVVRMASHQCTNCRSEPRFRCPCNSLDLPAAIRRSAGSRRTPAALSMGRCPVEPRASHDHAMAPAIITVCRPVPSRDWARTVSANDARPISTHASSAGIRCGDSQACRCLRSGIWQAHADMVERRPQRHEAHHDPGDPCIGERADPDVR